MLLYEALAPGPPPPVALAPPQMAAAATTVRLLTLKDGTVAGHWVTVPLTDVCLELAARVAFGLGPAVHAYPVHDLDETVATAAFSECLVSATPLAEAAVPPWLAGLRRRPRVTVHAHGHRARRVVASWRLLASTQTVGDLARVVVQLLGDGRISAGSMSLPGSRRPLLPRSALAACVARPRPWGRGPHRAGPSAPGR